MRRYRYFISYQYSNDKNEGFGSCEYRTYKKIKNGEDVRDIGYQLKKDFGFKGLVILNFRLF